MEGEGRVGTHKVESSHYWTSRLAFANCQRANMHFTGESVPARAAAVMNILRDFSVIIHWNALKKINSVTLTSRAIINDKKL